jgi:hypothetical protein
VPVPPLPPEPRPVPKLERLPVLKLVPLPVPKLVLPRLVLLQPELLAWERGPVPEPGLARSGSGWTPTAHWAATKSARRRSRR